MLYLMYLHQAWHSFCSQQGEVDMPKGKADYLFVIFMTLGIVIGMDISRHVWGGWADGIFAIVFVLSVAVLKKLYDSWKAR